MKKNIIIGSLLLTSIGVGIWFIRKKKKEQIKEEEQKPRTPEMLIVNLVKNILEEGKWKNERDFLSILTKQYIKESPDISWIDYLPVCQEDLLEKLNDLGLLDQYEVELEERYKKGYWIGE